MEERKMPMQGRPLDCTPRQLKRVGVTVLDVRALWLACDECGRRWHPTDLTGWRLPSGYWKCPNRCNEGH